MTCIQTENGPKWLGMYRGVVLQDDTLLRRDEHLGRLKVKVPLIHGENVTPESLPWAWPVFPGGGNNPEKGFIDLPAVDDSVIVFFEGGDLNSPVWMGGYYSKGKFPNKAKYGITGYKYPNIKMWRSLGGNMIRMIDEPGDPELEDDPASAEAIEIVAGTTDDHDEYDTYIRIDLIKKSMTVKSKYKMDVNCEDTINIKGNVINVTAKDTEAGKPPNITLKCSSGGGSSITMTPTSVRCNAKSVSGFEST